MGRLVHSLSNPACALLEPALPCSTVFVEVDRVEMLTFWASAALANFSSLVFSLTRRFFNKVSGTATCSAVGVEVEAAILDVEDESGAGIVQVVDGG